MKSRNRTKYVLLGLISKHPSSGYDIKKFIDKAVHYFWSESYGQIYPMLKSLVQDGLATVEKEEQDGKPDKNVYAITDMGRKVLTDWVLEPAEETPARYEILLKLYFGEHVGPAKSVEALKKYQEEQENKLSIFKDIENHMIHVCQHDPEKIYGLLTVRFGIAEAESRINWCQVSIAELLQLEENSQITIGGSK